MLRFLVVAESDRPAEATVAAAAIRRHHPEGQIVWLIADPRPVSALAAADGDQVRYAAEVTVDGLRYGDLVVALSPTAARWAVIPAVVASLLDEGGDETIVVVPATSRIYGPVDELIARAEGGSLLLPTRFDPASGSVSGGWIPEVGVFVPRSRPLLDWWSAEAGRWARSDELDDEVRSDPWSSFLDRSAGLAVMGDGRFRLSPVSAPDLRVDPATGEGPPLIDGRPLVLATFPCFDPQRPWWYLGLGDAEPHVLVSEVPALRRLLRDRARDLVDAGWTPVVVHTDAVLPGWRPAGLVAQRYRAALRDVVGTGQLPPNPYVAGEVAAFLAWVTDTPDRSATGLSLVADDLWDRRPDLARVFHNVKWRDRPRYARWMWTSALQEGEISTGYLPDPPRPRPARRSTAAPTFGVNLVGYHGSEAGLGVAVRRVAMALDAAGIPWTEVRYDRTNSRQRGRATGSDDAPYRFHLILITADQLPFFADDVGEEFFEDRYTIGLWYWETDAMTATQHSALGIVDEVWGATSYLRDVFAAHTDKPVQHIPIPLVFPATPDRATARQRLGFDERFTFLFSFDFLSIAYRKNPMGLLEAFRDAFPEPGQARLILKSINGDQLLDEREELLDAIAEVPDAELWDRYLDNDERQSLVAASDCYVSLHRSEGLGLTMAEAMAAGTPVIATRYSGNLDFMDDTSALLVDFREVEIGNGHFYPAEGHWAEPDLAHAAQLMRRIHGDPELATRLAAAGRRSIAEFSAPRAGDAAARRLRALWHS